jgi:hypothetical protein
MKVGPYAACQSLATLIAKYGCRFYMNTASLCLSPLIKDGIAS